MCNEEMLRKLLDEKLEEQKQEITQQLSNAFIEEINKLKAEQSKVIKEAISESLKENYERIFEKKLNQIEEAINKQSENLSERDKKIAKFIEGVGREIVRAFKVLEEKEENKITELGNKILDVLDDLGNAVVKGSDAVMDLQNSWGDTMLKNFSALLDNDLALKRILDGIQSSEKDRFDLLYSVTKSTKDLINRRSFGI